MAIDYTNVNTMSNLQMYTALLNIRDDYVKSGKFMEKNWTSKDGDTIFLRSPDDLEAYINTYKARVDADAGLSSYLTWSLFYA
jgi:hypothetical protein